MGTVSLARRIDQQQDLLDSVSESARSLSINLLNPLTDGRWFDLAAKHPFASVFHQSGWLRALVRTYGYEPFVLTTAGPNEQLQNGIVVCRLRSWLTGSRLVSLPFSDHCEPLLGGPECTEAIMECLRGYASELRYVELRPLYSACWSNAGPEPARSYYFHELDLSPNLSRIFGNMHTNSYQRKIRRAQRENLVYESGRSAEILADFYRLLLKTRRRHGLIPQPLKWFKNLVKYMGENLQIRLLRKNGSPVAAMLTLRHASKVVYKYGCSDAAHHHRGGMPYLFWKLIEESKQSGAATIDLGRSDIDNPGLILFKDRLGAARGTLTYYRYTNAKNVDGRASWKSRAFGKILTSLPDTFLSTAGGCFYKHLG